MAPQALLKTILLLLASSPTLLPCALAAPISATPSSETCISPYLRLLGPRACEILNLRTECSDHSKHQLVRPAHSSVDRVLLRRRESTGYGPDIADRDKFISIDSDAFGSVSFEHGMLNARPDDDDDDDDEYDGEFDPMSPEHGTIKAPDDGGFGAQTQPYRPPRLKHHPHRHHGGHHRRRMRGMCSRQGRGHHKHPLSLACQLLHEAGYRTRDFQRLAHKLWLAVRGMPEKFAVAGAVAVFLVVVILVAAEKVSRAHQSRRRKRKEWKGASRIGRRHTATPASRYKRTIRSRFRGELWDLLQKRASLLKIHLRPGANRPPASETNINVDVEKLLIHD